jgi:hypothetical protein
MIISCSFESTGESQPVKVKRSNHCMRGSCRNLQVSDHQHFISLVLPSQYAASYIPPYRRPGYLVAGGKGRYDHWSSPSRSLRRFWSNLWRCSDQCEFDSIHCYISAQNSFASDRPIDSNARYFLPSPMLAVRPGVRIRSPQLLSVDLQHPLLQDKTCRR